MDIKARGLETICARPDADTCKYRTLKGKSGKSWFFKIGKFAAHRIYVEGGPNSEGMGGALCSFELEDGTTVQTKGPWMTTAENLFNDTGFDLRDKYATRITMARQVDYPKNHYYGMPNMIDVVHHEEDFIEGTFHRPNELAQNLANKLGEKLYYFIETGGGAQSGWISPKE